MIIMIIVSVTTRPPNDDPCLILSTDSQLTRKAPASYADGVYAMNGEDRPSPRTLSQEFMKGQDGLSSLRNRTAMLTFFGKTTVKHSRDSVVSDGNVNRGRNGFSLLAFTP